MPAWEEHVFIFSEDLYWGNPGGHPANADSVETTAYALLAMLEFNDYKSSAYIVRWLTSQRDANGAFRTTQVTDCIFSMIAA